MRTCAVDNHGSMDPKHAHDMSWTLASLAGRQAGRHSHEPCLRQQAGRDASKAVLWLTSPSWESSTTQLIFSSKACFRAMQALQWDLIERVFNAGHVLGLKDRVRVCCC